MRPSDIGEYDLTLCHGPSKDITCRVFVQLAILLHDFTAKRTDTKRKERSFVSRHRFLTDVEVVQIHVKPCCVVVSTQDLASIGNLRCGFGFSRLKKHQANRTLQAARPRRQQCWQARRHRAGRRPESDACDSQRMLLLYRLAGHTISCIDVAGVSRIVSGTTACADERESRLACPLCGI